MDACTVLALLPFLCNEPEAPEPEEPVASEELVIEAQPAPEIAAATLSAPRASAATSSSSEMQGPAAPVTMASSAMDESDEDLPERMPNPTPQPVEIPRGTQPEMVAVVQEPNLAAARHIAANTDGEVVTMETPSGAEAVVLRPDDPDAAAVLIEPARVEHVQARSALLEGPFENPTDMEELLDRPRSSRPRRDFDRGTWGQDDSRD